MWSYLLLPLSSIATASLLYVTHYSGTVFTLSLDVSSTGYDLSIVHSQPLCGTYPSWLTFDVASNLIFCSDETGDATNNGSLSALAIADDGSLLEQAKTATPGSGVHNVVYEGDQGERYLAVAHYGGSAVSTFRLPLQSDDPPLQVFRYQLSQPGPKSQQDAPHPHQVRVYAIDKPTGHLHACPAIHVTAGDGPRHGVFERSQTGLTTLYIDTELGGHIISYAVSYLAAGGCPSFRQRQKLVAYPDGTMPEGATPAEIRLAGDELYVSVRSDQGFAPNDSMVTLDRTVNGTLAVRESTSSYGTVPRTFASSTVAVVKRDVATGALGEEVAHLQVGEPGPVGTMTGLSSVIWVE
ncbi:Lactonase, 7-bladed beta-propeller-domain-containing protein [Aspergillus welwitschiae]|uniref:Lactonase, 7-bladed beta-propeller-domain-containing protein n=1 Tax=Aspergillus welwitschiae TaxID=1341132 RepID=A0A3F3PKU7_9EURO|nr:Lactonase, 7-bladed beta-propeller-domain-containing protein [Aspergillus welwitschiae]RDH27539.1 Lactonase, 7-bladed beta-propeller-domain-containing protein [Aspergillus welwitschiae]